MTRDALAQLWRAYQHRGWRRGQALFNAIARLDQDRADAIRGTDTDPFYDDGRIEACLVTLEFEGEER